MPVFARIPCRAPAAADLTGTSLHAGFSGNAAADTKGVNSCFMPEKSRYMSDLLFSGSVFANMNIQGALHLVSGTAFVTVPRYRGLIVGHVPVQ